ncbi:MAG TPA: hypothetical protein VKU00_03880, partial [Chthonomonadaceae bacterium]|nr:hypothetical protein [Chthonomonadaceae bacterium]
SRLHVGESHLGVVWQGSSLLVGTRLGQFMRGVPRFDVPEAEHGLLGPEFALRWCRETKMERRPWQEVL